MISSNPRLASKFGGVKPYMPAGKVWPVCEACEDKKTFVCQINIRQAPKVKQLPPSYLVSKSNFKIFLGLQCEICLNLFNNTCTYIP